MTKELILVVTGILFLVLAFYAINITSRLPLSKSKKQVLYWISLIVPLLGLILAWHYQKKANSNG